MTTVSAVIPPAVRRRALLRMLIVFAVGLGLAVPVVVLAPPWQAEGKSFPSPLVWLYAAGWAAAICACCVFPAPPPREVVEATGRRRERRFDALAIGVLGAITIALWLPFGLNVLPSADGWAVWNYGYPFTPTLWAFPANIPSRVFVMHAFSLAYWLYGENFTAFNGVLLLTFWAKSVVLYILIKRIFPLGTTLAFVTAVLLLVYPMDQGVFYLGALNVHVNVLVCLLGVLAAWEYTRHPARWRLLLLMGLQVYALAAYEAGVSFLLAAALAFAPRAKFRKRYSVIGLLSLQSLLWGIYYTVALIVATPRYQGEMLGTSAAQPLLQRIIFTIARAFFSPVLEIAEGSARGIAQVSIWIIIAFGIGTSVFIILRLRSRSNLFMPSRLSLVNLIFMGMLVVFLGLAIYLPTDIFGRVMLSNARIWRVFYFSTVGVAIVLAIFPLVIRSFVKTVSIELVYGLLVGVATLGAFYQHARFADRADEQADILRQITRQTGVSTGDAFLVLIDASPEREVRPLFFDDYVFSAALRVVTESQQYGGRICAEWGSAEETLKARECLFTNNGLASADTPLIPYDRLLLFRYTATDQPIELLDAIPAELGADEAMTAAYNPAALINDEIPPRACTMLGLCE